MSHIHGANSKNAANVPCGHWTVTCVVAYVIKMFSAVYEIQTVHYMSSRSAAGKLFHTVGTAVTVV